MNGADEQVGGVAQAEPLQPPAKFARALLTIGDTRHPTGCSNVLGEDSREFQHQRFGLTAAGSCQDDAMPARIVGRLLAGVTNQLGGGPSVSRADVTQRHCG